MAFDLAQWKQALASNLRAWKAQMAAAGVTSAYAFIAAAALWPVAQAAQQGDWSALMALGGVTAGLGTNLLANQIQRWKDAADAAAQLASQVDTAPALRQELDAVLEKLEALDAARNALAEADRAWFAKTLGAELARLGNLDRYRLALFGKGNVVVAGNDNQVTVTYGDAPGDEAERQRATARRRYLAKLRRDCSILPLAAMGGDETLDEEVTLDRVYIDLDTTTPVPLTAQEQAARQERAGRAFGAEGETRPLPALQAAAAATRLALLGEPGSGKSTFVRRLIEQVAAAGLGECPPPPGFEEGLTPLYITLRNLAPRLAALDLAGLPAEQARQALAGAVRDQLRQEVERLETPEFAPELESVLDSHACLLVLDGLDEVPYDLRGLVRQAVGATLQTHQPQRVIITCRVRSYVGAAVLPNFQPHTLAAFDSDRIAQFASAWYNTQKMLGRFDERQAQDKAGDLAEAANSQDLQELSSNPMMLTTMAIIHQREVGLPRERVRLYNLAVDVLLRRWQKGKTGVLADFLRDDLRLRATMERLAYQAHRAGRGVGLAADLARGEALTLLEAPEFLGSAGLAAEFLDYVDQRAGLVVGRGGEFGRPAVYGFPHRTFQEYLAGCYLAGQRDAVRVYFTHAGEGDYWDLAAELGAEELYYNRRSVNPLLDLAYHLCGSGAPRDAQQARAALWSAQMAALAGREIVERDTLPDGGPAYLERLIPRLVELLASDLTAPERADAGKVLARFGDPRAQVLQVGAMEFCVVPPGPFVMGRAEDKHTNKTLDYPYWLARFPVTVAQWSEFVRKSGHTPRDEDSLRDPANHPVRLVTWHEALAFCRWLNEAYGKQLPQGYHFILPSEAEWEKGARGGMQIPAQPYVRRIVQGLAWPASLPSVANRVPEREYPWEGEFDANRANTSETGIGATSAVGCFARGASPYGIEELSGNVWEWTRSVYKPYPYQREDGREKLDAGDNQYRVVRGGASSTLSTTPAVRSVSAISRTPWATFRGVGWRRP
ncbi:MAG: SUMF1/EgtB/PvdO family nonheme iron enzyme [Anaerolineae bacterium]